MKLSKLEYNGFEPDLLTQAEVNVLHLAAKGYVNRHIGKTLGVHPRTARRQFESGCAKAGIPAGKYTRRAGVVRWWYGIGD